MDIGAAAAVSGLSVLSREAKPPRKPDLMEIDPERVDLHGLKEGRI